MKTNTFLKMALMGACIALAHQSSQAAIIGQWTFDGSNPLADSTGHFGDLSLQGSASTVGGALDVNGTHTLTSGWARTTSYTGATLTDKTFVTWVTLQNLSVFGGAVMALDSTTVDQYDGVVFGERQLNAWMSGSSYHLRTQDFVPGAVESGTGTQVMLAMSYDDLGGGNVQVTGYRDGVQIGQYTTANAASWTAGDTEVLFGVRSTMVGNAFGALDASINEARLYDSALSQSEIVSMMGSVSASSVPVVPTLGLMGLGLCAFAATQRRRQA